MIAAIGPFTISSLGLFLALAFFFGSFSIWQRAKEEHYEDNDIFDTIFLAFFGGIIGARLAYILLNFNDFGFDFGKWINLSYSNHLSWFGFLIGLMYLLRLVAKQKKWEFFHFADGAVFGVIVAQILLRVGQFLDGSYVGAMTSLPWGLVFPGIEGARHPLPLYEIMVMIGTYFLLRWFDKHYRLFSWYQDNRGEAQPGFLWLTYLTVFLISQFIFDFMSVRYPVFWVFTLYQVVLIVAFKLTLFTFWLRAGNKINLPSVSNPLSSSEQEELVPIREPLVSPQPRNRPRRFSRARTGRDANAA